MVGNFVTGKGNGIDSCKIIMRIVEALPAGEALLVQQDCDYRDRSAPTQDERAKANYDEPDALENELLAAQLTELREGRAIDAPQYDFATHTRRPGPGRV